MKTKSLISYEVCPYGKIAEIPAGTRVTRATNLPNSKDFWAEKWVGMTESQESWAENYGFLIEEKDVEFS